MVAHVVLLRRGDHCEYIGLARGYSQALAIVKQASGDAGIVMARGPNGNEFGVHYVGVDRSKSEWIIMEAFI